MFKKLIFFSLIQVFILILGVAIWIFSPNSERFHQNFLHGVLDNFSRLKNTDRNHNKKIILIGGSSLGFSVSAEKLTRELGLPVLNFGVHAGIGYKNIWRLNRPHLDPETDILVISPEYGSLVRSKPYSVEFCQVLFLRKEIPPLFENPDCVFEILKQTGADLFYYTLGLKHPRNVYFREAFNPFGDVVSHLELKNRVFPLGEAYKIHSPAEVQDYISFVREEMILRGFKVIYIPTVIPQSSCRGKEGDLIAFQSFMMDVFGQKGSPEIEDLCFPDDYFFDTNYHLKREGIEKKTAIFYNHLNQELLP